jgi:hypothetical protein
VDEGEPALPKPTAAKLAEEEVRRLDREQGMHMVGKHSPAVPDQVWRQRAVDGTDPITGTTPRSRKGNPSSRFSSWEMQLKAYKLATSRKENGLPPFTGRDQKNNNIVRMELPGAGEGYIPNKQDPSNPTLVAMDRFEMKVDPDTGIPFTLFPIK